MPLSEYTVRVASIYKQLSHPGTMFYSRPSSVLLVLVLAMLITLTLAINCYTFSAIQIFRACANRSPPTVEILCGHTQGLSFENFAESCNHFDHIFEKFSPNIS